MHTGFYWTDRLKYFSVSAIALDDEVGNFKVGKYFDALIVNMKNPGPVDVLEQYDTETLMQKFLYTGDDRNIKKVYVAGRQVK
jgi:guanine deaminase